MTIEALLNRTEDVEKMADQARHDGRLLSPYEQDIWIAGHASRDAEVERLKRAVKVMADALGWYAEDLNWMYNREPGMTSTLLLSGGRRSKEALAKAEVILKEGG